MSLENFRAKYDEIGGKALAAALGVSESTVRVVANGHYKGNVAIILDKFNQEFAQDSYVCPHSQNEITRVDCEQRANGPRPFGGYSKQLWWDACQTCQYNKQGDNNE